MKNTKLRERRLRDKRDEYAGKTIRGCEVLDVVNNKKNYSLVLKCTECGEVFNRKMSRFLSGKSMACLINHEKKKRKERLSQPKEKPNPNHGKHIRKDWIGRKIGRFTVLEHVGFHYTRKGKTIPRFLCQCECGEKCVINGDVIKTRKLCDKELIEFKREQGRTSSEIKRNKRNKKKTSVFRGLNGRQISKFSKSVYDKHYGICTKCREWHKKEDTAAHHIIPISKNKNIALFPSNGMLLCSECHNEFHHKYGQVHFDYMKIFEYAKGEEKQEQQLSLKWWH